MGFWIVKRLYMYLDSASLSLLWAGFVTVTIPRKGESMFQLQKAHWLGDLKNKKERSKEKIQNRKDYSFFLLHIQFPICRYLISLLSKCFFQTRRSLMGIPMNNYFWYTNIRGRPVVQNLLWENGVISLNTAHTHTHTPVRPVYGATPRTAILTLTLNERLLWVMIPCWRLQE